MQWIEGQVKRWPDNKYIGHLRGQEEPTKKKKKIEGKSAARLLFSDSLTGKTILR